MLHEKLYKAFAWLLGFFLTHYTLCERCAFFFVHTQYFSVFYSSSSWSSKFLSSFYTLSLKPFEYSAIPPCLYEQQ